VARIVARVEQFEWSSTAERLRFSPGRVLECSVKEAAFANACQPARASAGTHAKTASSPWVLVFECTVLGFSSSGVMAAAYISDVPMGGGVAADLLVPEGKVFAPGEPPRSTQSRFISPGVFATLRIPMVAGRDLTWSEIYEKRPVALISEGLARTEWGSPTEALGKRLRGSSSADAWREIVGVVGDVHDRGLSQPVLDTVYYPVLGERVYNSPVYVWRPITYVIRSSRAETPSFLEEIRKAVWAVDTNLPLVNIRTMGDVLGQSMARTSFALVMLTIAGGMALLLSLIGIYGVISYAVSRRTREIGVRIALGAEGSAVRRMFVRHGLVLAAIGVALGLGGAVGLTRWIRSLLFEVSPFDPATYAVVSVILLTAATLACYLPARRATTVDPIEALRAE
jgi:predicted permease